MWDGGNVGHAGAGWTTRSDHLHSRRDLLKGIAAGAAAAVAAPMGAAIGATVTPENQTPGSADCTPVVGSGSPRAGWCVYDHSAIDAAHFAALRALRPTILRWFVSWDRYHLQPRSGGNGGLVAPPDWLNGPYREFFEELAPSTLNPRGTTLVVQMQVKGPSWEGDSQPSQNPGTKWARWDQFYGRQYPDRFGVAATYGAFVKGLDAALAPMNVDVIWEAWNEADLRGQLGASGAAENFLDPWYVNPFNLFNGVPWYYWSGGAGELWHSLYQQLPRAGWGTSGLVKPNWVQRTAQFPEVGYLGLHRYFPYGAITATNFVKDIEKMVTAWDQAAPHLPKRKVFLGECGIGTTVQDTNLQFAATLFRRHEALSQANEDPASPLYGRYVGTTAHSGGRGVRSTWELDPADPAAAWWQYKSGYEQYTA